MEAHVFLARTRSHSDYDPQNRTLWRSGGVLMKLLQSCRWTSACAVLVSLQSDTHKLYFVVSANR
jgi:hypothetical protein